MTNGEWLLIGLGLSFVLFLANRISAWGKSGACGSARAKSIPARIRRLPILFETSKSASLYRTKDEAFLMLHVLMTNQGGETLVIREIEAAMGNGKGVMVDKTFSATATHSGRKSSYSFGSSGNLLPLSLAGSGSRDAYLCFAFSDADIGIGDVALRVFTSGGTSVVPVDVDVIG